MRRLTIAAGILGWIAALPAFAGGDNCPFDLNLYVRNLPNTFSIEKFTNYEPEKGGINGSCGKSATAGIDACKGPLEAQLKGQVDIAVVAVPQEGGSSNLFGGVYHAIALEKQGLQSQSGCTRVAAADHYGKSSNGKNKMDVVTKANSKLASKINSASGTMELVGVVEELRSGNGNGRRVKRHPRAVRGY